MPCCSLHCTLCDSNPPLKACERSRRVPRLLALSRQCLLTSTLQALRHRSVALTSNYRMAQRIKSHNRITALTTALNSWREAAARMRRTYQGAGGGGKAVVQREAGAMRGYLRVWRSRHIRQPRPLLPPLWEARGVRSLVRALLAQIAPSPLILLSPPIQTALSFSSSLILTFI